MSSTSLFPIQRTKMNSREHDNKVRNWMNFIFLTHERKILFQYTSLTTMDHKNIMGEDLQNLISEVSKGFQETSLWMESGQTIF